MVGSLSSRMPRRSRLVNTAATYEEHLRNVARWRSIERQRAGLPPLPEAAPLDTLVTPAPAAPGAEPPVSGAAIRPPQPAPR